MCPANYRQKESCKMFFGFRIALQSGLIGDGANRQMVVEHGQAQELARMGRRRGAAQLYGERERERERKCHFIHLN
jgi:hypothetical protein